MAVDETPIASSLNIHMIPPPAPRQQSIPQIAWVLGALLVVAIMGGISYFLVLRPRSQAVAPVVPPAVAKVTPAQIPQPPVTPAAQPAAPLTATTAPATAAEPTTPKPTEAPPKPAVASKPEPRARAAAKVGQLMVSANVNGARISVDGQSDPSWLTPHTIADLPAGAHNVVISMDGYDNFQQSVTIESGQTSNVVGSLSSPRAELDVVTEPPGVEVIIDGKSYGPSPARATLAPGNHTYMVKWTGMAPSESTVALQGGQIITKRLSLQARVPTGIALVRTIPPGATVLADGSPIDGQTPTSFRLKVGSHTLVVSLSGYRPIQQQVTVSENETTTVNITLTSQ
jgi:hypothetical protein